MAQRSVGVRSNKTVTRWLGTLSKGLDKIEVLDEYWVKQQHTFSKRSVTKRTDLTDEFKCSGCFQPLCVPHVRTVHTCADVDLVWNGLCCCVVKIDNFGSRGFVLEF